MTRRPAGYFQPGDDGMVPWHKPLAPDWHFFWELAPRSGVTEAVGVDYETYHFLEAVKEALDAYDRNPPPQAMRAGVLIELLASALEDRGGRDLVFQFHMDYIEADSRVPARPKG